MISQRELDEMRDAIGDLFPDVCNVLTVTETADGYGGVTQAWGTAVRNAPCRVDIRTDLRSSNLEKVAGASLKPFQVAVISLKYSIALTDQNRIEHNGITYNVKPVNSDSSWRVVTRAELQKT